eukprot:scaffold14195_cov65-Cyclotella_meneghiniana.AAC.11
MATIDLTNWIGDGIAGSHQMIADDTLTISAAKQGTPFNVRLCTGDISGDLYYEVSILDLSGSLAVGLVSEEGFLPGWKTKGYFYNGNLSDGSAGLVIGFGPKTEVGATLGVFLKRQASSFQVIFYHNGRCLGPGFSIRDSNNVPLFPCLHVSGKATVKVSSGAVPSVLTRSSEGSADDGYTGTWKINQLFAGPELMEYPLTDEKRAVTLNVEKLGEEKQYRLTLKIVNTFVTTIELAGKMEAFDSIKFITQTISTKMLPPPELSELESMLGHGLHGGQNESNGFKKMIVNSAGGLLISGPITEMSFVKYEQVFEPVTSI